KTRMDAPPPSLDGILALKGVIDIGEREEKPEERLAAERAIVAGFAQALSDLAKARQGEGAALADILGRRLEEIADLATRAETAPGRQPEAIKARLAEQVATLLQSSERFDADRLHQEAVLIASRADIREELDRLKAHVAQAKTLIAKGGAIGR